MPSTADVVVVIASSAGGIPALVTVLPELPAELPAAVVIVQHRPEDGLLQKVLASRSRLPVVEVRDGETLHAGRIYIAPPRVHLTITSDRRFATVDGRRIRGVLASANPLFESAAQVFGSKAIAVVLSGSGLDGTDGVQAVKSGGGTVIAQDEETSVVFGMPRSAIATGAVDLILGVPEIARAIVQQVAARQSAV